MLKSKLCKIDNVFSQLIRERANWQCESCGLNLYDNRASLHCSHLESRRHRALRWHSDNAVAHCFICHEKLGNNRPLFDEWIVGKFGQKRLDWLQRQKAKPFKIIKPDKELIYQYLSSQLQDLLQIRDSGEYSYVSLAPSPLLPQNIPE